MKKATLWQRVGDFIVGKGFYIVLFLCVATIGISGYYLVSVFTGGETPSPSLAGENDPPAQSVTGSAQVTIPIPEGPNPSTLLPEPDDPVQPSVTEPDPAPDATEPAPVTAPSPAPEPEPAPPEEPDKTDPGEGTGSHSPGTSQVLASPVYTWPVRGEVIRGFSLEVLAYDETMGDWRTHSGVDLSAAVGTRVMAISDGTVSKIYEDDLMGTTVVIDHGDGLVSSYFNLASRPTVSEGDKVSTGTVIGAVGETALAEIGHPPHLHLEVTQDGRQIDPVNYLPGY